MASNNTPPTCSVCANPAAKHCAGCVSEELTKLLGHRMPTLYCSKTCQEDDWKSHKKLCHLAQAQTKLFRTGETLQEIFLATRAEAFDLLLARVECSGDDIIHIYQATETPLPRIRPLSVNLPADRKVKHAVLSYRAGTDALSGMMFQLGQELLKGYSTKVEEIHVRVFAAKVKVHYHRSGNNGDVIRENRHAVLCVTLKDGSTWVIDPTGAQHGQHKPVLRFSEYNREYIALELARNQHGMGYTSFNPHRGEIEHGLLSEHWSHHVDELHEWVHKNVAIKQLLKVKSSEYENLRKTLVAHLATEAREYVKFNMRDPTSTARPIIFSSVENEKLSEEDKGRAQRKKDRILASKDPDTRKMIEEAEASGNQHVSML